MITGMFQVHYALITFEKERQLTYEYQDFCTFRAIIARCCQYLDPEQKF